MDSLAIEVAQKLDKQILIWAVILLCSAGLVMAKIIATRFDAILTRLDLSVDRLTLGFERLTIIVEHHEEDIKELKGRPSKRNKGQ